MANPEHVAAVKSGFARFQAWREHNHPVALDLSGADLMGISLSPGGVLDVLIDHPDDPKGADLQGANLSGADLSSADLSAANLSRANLASAILHLAILKKADLTNADLTEANLREANLHGTRLQGATLKGIDLRDAKFAKMQWGGQGLALEYRKNFNGIDLEGATLMGLDFSGMTLKSANLRRCNLSDAKFQSAFLEGAILDEASIAEADFTNAELSDASFRNANLGKVVFTDAKAYDVHFDSADVIGCQFTNTVLEGADFSRATLTAPIFSRASLRFARFDGAIMSEPTDFLPDRTFSNSIGYATTPNDPWSTLRRKYTGIRFALNLLLLILFVLPYTTRALFWLGIHTVESSFIDERTGQLVLDLRQEVEWLRSLSSLDPQKFFESATLAALKSRSEASRSVLARLSSAPLPGASVAVREARDLLDTLDRLAERKAQDAVADVQRWQERARVVADSVEPFLQPWQPTPVWRLTFGGELTLVFVMLTTFQVLYQLLRGFLTLRVGTLRDEEILAGCSPAKDQYDKLVPLHRVASVLFYTAMVSLIIHSYLWLSKPVWFPS